MIYLSSKQCFEPSAGSFVVVLLTHIKYSTHVHYFTRVSHLINYLINATYRSVLAFRAISQWPPSQLDVLSHLTAAVIYRRNLRIVAVEKNITTCVATLHDLLLLLGQIYADGSPAFLYLSRYTDP